MCVGSIEAYRACISFKVRKNKEMSERKEEDRKKGKKGQTMTVNETYRMKTFKDILLPCLSAYEIFAKCGVLGELPMKQRDFHLSSGFALLLLVHVRIP